jgi:hypothetical protein
VDAGIGPEGGHSAHPGTAEGNAHWGRL